MTRRHAALAAAVAATALAGCGSSNEKLSYSDFISEANKVCRDGSAELAKATDAGKLGDILDKYLKKFEDLKPPDKLKPEYDQFVSITKQQIEKLNASDIDGANALGPKSNAVASKMGTQDCINE